MFEVRLRVRTVLGDTHVSGYYDDRELALDVFTILSEQGEFVEFVVHLVPELPCVREFGPHEEHNDCEAMLATMNAEPFYPYQYEGPSDFLE